MMTVRSPDVPADSAERALALAGRLVRLELELARAEVRSMLRGAIVSVAIGLAGALLLGAGLVVLVAAVLAPLFGAVWEHLALAGGLTVLAALTAVAVSAWRLRRLGRPRLTLASLEETWQWLEAQLKSRLRLS
jgi:Putative Actinobacterial Holin-X, holin superfamily III